MEKRYKKIEGFVPDKPSAPESKESKVARHKKLVGTKPVKPKADELQKNNPLHGLKLADILDYLIERYGWEELGERITINCFRSNPTVKSSLKFLRKTPWAREKVETLYLRSK